MQVYLTSKSAPIIKHDRSRLEVDTTQDHGHNEDNAILWKKLSFSPESAPSQTWPILLEAG